MARLEIKLLGTFQAILDGQVLTGFRSDKARALLAYLAVEGMRPHRRDWLATLLWGNFNDRAARRSLSSALANLRQLLTPLLDAAGASPILESDRNQVWLNADATALSLDVLTFRELHARNERHGHRAPSQCPSCIEWLEQAANIYTGPFLPGMAFSDSPAFDEWQRNLQEILHQQALQVLSLLAEHYLAAGNYARAEPYARRQISLQPWQEEAHRQLMQILAGAGQRNAALAQYELCRSILAAELDVEPEEATTALYEQIRRGAPPEDALWSAVAPENPYRGLQPFRESDAAHFHGRKTITSQMVEAVQRRNLLAVIGPSGSGKSSLIHAGLIHQLHTQSDHWSICEIRPGKHPFYALAAAIAAHVGSLANAFPWNPELERESLAEALASGTLSLARLLSNASGEPGGLLLLLDQFEELYTLCDDSQTQQRFVDVLLETAQAALTPRVVVLLAVRADFMGQLLAHRALADALQDGTIMVGPMNRQELEQAIANPARSQGMQLQDGLVARMLNDVGHAPGQLPLLEFALTQLWERQTGGVLTHQAYEAIGQVEGALASYAEQVYAVLSPAEQEVSRRVLTQMIQLGQDTDDVRRPVAAAEVSAEDWALIQRLADQRLVVTDQDVRGQQTAEIAHEALIRGWKRLRSWLDADRAFQLWLQRARVAADQWLASERDPGALLRGAPLAEAEQWNDLRGQDLPLRVQGLIAASRAQRQQEEADAEARRESALAQAQALASAEHQRADVEARANRRLRWLALSLSLVTLLAILAGALAFTQRNEALRQSELAQSAQATADAERSLAQKEASLALARQLAAQSLNLAGSAPDLSVLLALHALRLNENPLENSAFLLDLTLNPLLGAVLHGQDSSVFGTTVSPDGRVLASSGENGSIWLWDLERRQLLGPPLTGHRQPVQALAWSPDGDRLISGDWSGVLRFWNVPEQQALGDPIIGHAAAVTALAYSADGQTVYSTSDQGDLKTWDAASGASVGDALALVANRGMAFSADGQLVAGNRQISLTVQNVVDGQLLGPPMAQHSASIHDVAFSPDGSLLASAGFDGITVVWDIATGDPIFPPLTGHDGRVLAVAWSPDSRLLATGGTDARVILWDAQTGQALGAPLVGHGNWVRTLTWTPDGGTLISGDAAGRLILWDMRKVRWLSGHDGTVRGLAFSPDGKALASGSFDQTVLVRDVASGEPLYPALRGHENAVLNVAYSPDGRYLVSASAGGDLVRWDAATGRQIGQPLRRHDGPVAGVAISPDSKIIASGSFDNTFILWSSDTGEPLFEPSTPHAGWVISLAFSPDGRTLASGSADTTIRLWDVATGKAIGQALQGHTGWVTDLAWSPDGATLVSASLDGTVRFWNVATGQPAGQPLAGHRAPVWSVEFNPADGGHSLYSGDNSGTVIQWDVATRQALAPPLHSAMETESMAISPDGRILAIGLFNNSGLVNLWALPEVSWTESVCAIANRDLTQEERTSFLGSTAYAPMCSTP